MASQQANSAPRSPEPRVSSEDEDTGPIIRRRRTRATMEAPAIPSARDPQPAPEQDSEPDLESEPTPTPATRKRGRPPGSKNKKGTKRSRREAEKASTNRGMSAAEKKAQKKLKEEGKKLEDEEQTIKRQHNSLNDDFPIVKNGELPGIIGPRRASFREQGDGASSAKDDISAMKDDIENGKRSNYGKLMTLWKLCIRIFRCSPFALLSPVQGLVYLPVSKPEEDPSAIWNQTFCEELSHILTHPVWAGEIEFLQTALQYAVICRTNDRRRWTMPLVNIDGGPLVRLKAAMQDSPDPLPSSVHEMHCDARGDGPATVIRCEMSNLLMQIGETAKEKEQSKGASRFSGPRKSSVDGFSVYGVTIVDLKTIRKAIDSLERVGSRVHRSTDVSYQEFMKARNTNTDMPEMKQLAEFHKRAWLHEKRRMDCAKGLDGQVERGDEANLRVRSRLSSSGSASVSSDGVSVSADDEMDVDEPSLGDLQMTQTQDGDGLVAADVEMQNDGWGPEFDNMPSDHGDEDRSEVLSPSLSIRVFRGSETPHNDDGPSEVASPALSTRVSRGSEAPRGKSTPVPGSPTLSTH